jgi:hypothetical protein
VWVGLVVIGFSLAACGGGSLEDGSNSFNASDAAGGATEKTDETPGADPSTKPEVVFIRQKPSGGRREVMQALAVGRLVVDEVGCFRLRDDRAGGRGDLVVWPPGYSMRVEDGEIQIVRGGGQTIARVGDNVRMGGGQIATSTGSHGMYEEFLNIPEKCTGPLWIVGEVVSTTQ